MRPRSALAALVVAAAALTGPGAAAVAAPEPGPRADPAPAPQGAPAAALPAVIATIPTSGHPSDVLLDTARNRAYSLTQDWSWSGNTWSARYLAAVSDTSADRAAGSVSLGSFAYSWSGGSYSGGGTAAFDLALETSTGLLFAPAVTESFSGTYSYSSSGYSGSSTLTGTSGVLVASGSGVIRKTDVGSIRSDWSYAYGSSTYLSKGTWSETVPISVSVDPRRSEVIVPLGLYDGSYSYTSSAGSWAYSYRSTTQLGLAVLDRSGSLLRIVAVPDAKWVSSMTYGSGSAYSWSYVWPWGSGFNSGDGREHVAVVEQSGSWSGSTWSGRQAVSDYAIALDGRALSSTLAEVTNGSGTSTWSWLAPWPGRPVADPAGSGFYVPLTRYSYTRGGSGSTYSFTASVFRSTGGGVSETALGDRTLYPQIGFDGGGGTYADFLRVTPDWSTWTNVVAPVSGASGAPIQIGSSSAWGGSLVGNRAAQRLYVADPFRSVVTVVDLAAGQVVTTVPVGSYPFAMATDRTAGRVYTGNWSGESLSVIDDSSAVPGEVKRGLSVDTRTR